MPYKNSNKNREYQREWQRRKKAGLDTRIVGKKPILSPEERNKRRRDSNKKHRARLKLKRDEVWGDSCFICDSTMGLVLHKKDGTLHRLTGVNILPHALKEPDKWVRLCKLPCHKGVHFCMDIFNWSWEDIVARIDGQVV